MNVATLFQSEAVQWVERLFARDGMGWPLFIILGIGYCVFRFAKWFGPLVERLVQAAIDFMASLDTRLERIENDGRGARADLHNVASKLDELTGEVRSQRGVK